MLKTVQRKGVPCFTAEVGPSAHKVFITTIPKSGTYLVGEILRQMGFVYSGVFLSTTTVEDHRGADLETLRTQPGMYLHEESLEVSSKLVLPGQYTMGHVPACEHIKPYKIIFVYRDLRSVIVSCTRYYQTRKAMLPALMQKVWENIEMSPQKVRFWLEQWGEEYFHLTNRLFNDWYNNENIFKIQHETLNKNVIEELSHYLDCPMDIDTCETILNNAFGTDTPTRNTQPTKYLDYWDEETEKMYCDQGFDAINLQMGYK